MIGMIESLIKHHGFASAQINIKPQPSGGLAAIINLIPDNNAVVSEGVRNALAHPIIAVSENGVGLDLSLDAALSPVYQSIAASDYLDSTAVADRITKACETTKSENAPKKAAKDEESTSKVETNPMPAAPTPDELFGDDDSL